MSLVEFTKQKMSELGIDAKRSLGQNFLVSEHAITKICDEIVKNQWKQIIEVGPGLGSLTEALIKIHRNIFLIELDRVFFKYWQDRGQTIVNADALDWDWQIADPINTLFVSNLPYQISSRILIDRCLDKTKLGKMILMFQKEVAVKIRAKQTDPDYGMLSVMVQTFWKPKKLLELSTRDFYPAPKIASQVLVFESIPCTIDPEGFLTFLKLAFSHPRKMMISNLTAGYPRLKALEAFGMLGISENTRAAQLTIAQFQELYQKLN
jgi:16S rRNA (adenine1518-N6/adenine1519-N6)-dimethyltransferase